MNFDSKVLLRGTKDTVGSALDHSAENAEELADKLGFFAAIDSVVQGLTQLPLKVNQVFSQVEQEVEEELEADMVEKSLAEFEDDDEAVVDVQITVNDEEVALDFDSLEDDIKKAVENRIAGKSAPVEEEEKEKEIPK